MPPSRFFPPAEMADEEGLLAVGGSLSPAWLLDAYRHGVFPWPLGPKGAPMFWWSLDPRAILELDGLRISRRLARTLRGGRFQVTCNRDFSGVIAGCAMGPGREDGTWITLRMIDAYTRLHRLGHAHSVEVWYEGCLAGGLYGVAIAGLFSAESKFYRVRDASKVALAHLVAHLRRRGYRLLDLQQLTPHTARLGAIEIPRRDYLARLADALAAPVSFGDQLESDGAPVA
ncbi:MAG: leucyl/phenylalanyl-tRNA--protein transferase [Pirellulales bacterium]|nr:leucyl/phenylalanyl-tRNA--protein transferase [Pirellulales bacterium]